MTDKFVQSETAQFVQSQTGLQALVAVELKKTKFHPRDLGQLEFYLEALDRDVKRSNENPSIGIILCPDADKVVVEYAMSRSMSPTMIA